MATTERTSLLTQGLAPLAQHSPTIRNLLEQLYTLDDAVQEAHTQAKADDEFGELVVARYTTFLALREVLISELEQQQISVPWQLRLRIDEIELTLRQRNEKQNGKPSVTSVTTTTTTTASPQISDKSTALPPASPRERRVVMLLVPSIIVLVLALLWYQWFS